MTDTAPRGPVQIEGLTNIDGEPLFGWQWGDGHGGGHDRSPPFDGNRWGSCTTLNRNIGDPSTVTPEADQ